MNTFTFKTLYIKNMINVMSFLISIGLIQNICQVNNVFNTLDWKQKRINENDLLYIDLFKCIIYGLVEHIFQKLYSDTLIG